MIKTNLFAVKTKTKPVFFLRELDRNLWSGIILGRTTQLQLELCFKCHPKDLHVHSVVVLQISCKYTRHSTVRREPTGRGQNETVWCVSWCEGSKESCRAPNTNLKHQPLLHFVATAGTPNDLWQILKFWTSSLWRKTFPVGLKDRGGAGWNFSGLWLTREHDVFLRWTSGDFGRAAKFWDPVEKKQKQTVEVAYLCFSWVGSSEYKYPCSESKWPASGVIQLGLHHVFQSEACKAFTICDINSEWVTNSNMCVSDTGE